jgi:hypothetical protein
MTEAKPSAFNTFSARIRTPHHPYIRLLRDAFLAVTDQILISDSGISSVSKCVQRNRLIACQAVPSPSRHLTRRLPFFSRQRSAFLSPTLSKIRWSQISVDVALEERIAFA